MAHKTRLTTGVTLVMVVLLSLFTMIASANASTRSPFRHTSSPARVIKLISTGSGKVQPKPKTTPRPTPTVTPTATPTVTPTVTPTPAGGSPSLILTQAAIDAIRARIAQGLEPQTSAFSSFMSGPVAHAMVANPIVFAGPLAAGGVGSDLELALDRDGQYARDLGLAYVLTGDTSYATRARAFLTAWAQGNTPTSFSDTGDKWGGSYQAHGAFMFAYAYDLTYNSSAYSDADRAAIASYFRRFVDTLDSYNTKLRSEWVITHPDYTQPYQWDASKSYHVYETYVGSDMALLQQTARLAMARTIGYQAAVDSILNDSSNILGLQSMAKAALSPRNDGDGVSGAGAAPHIYVYAQYVAGRGGMFDYMTYNTRIVNVAYDLAVNAGWNATKSAEVKGRLQKTWTYFGRFFGANAESDFNPTDVISKNACLPRFSLAWRDFGDQHFADILNSGARSNYYEPQLLGPVTLTHSIVR